ncbi:MAG: RNA polymerase sigma factor [Candidatus Eisenbacteria bacterium]
MLHAAVFAALRAQSRRIVPVSAEDLEDLAAAKALELLEQAEGNRWEPAGRAAHEVMGYLWRVARNALVDLARRRGREAPPPLDDAGWDRALQSDPDREAGPLEMTVAQEFVSDLGDCLEALSPRSRAVWTLRALFERPSRDIAAALALKAPHVDVLVQRAREAISECMTRKGHEITDVHPQAFVLLWQRWSTAGRRATFEVLRPGRRTRGVGHD